MIFIMKRKKFAKIFIIIVILIICWGFVWSWFITKTVRENEKNSKMKHQHAIVKNIIVTETREEKKYWEFYAKTGEYHSDNNSILLNDIIGNFYDKDENVELSFKTNKGTYDEKNKKVILNGDNLFVSRNGSQLYADELIWQGRDEDILANGNVQFIQEGQLLIKSEHARFNTSLTHFKAEGKVKTRAYSDDDAKKKYTQL